MDPGVDIQPILSLLADCFGVGQSDLLALALAGLRIAPLVFLVPALGLQALPLPLRIAFVLVLALAASPAWLPIIPADDPWPVLAVRELLLGVPVALGTAVLLWAATMAGDLVALMQGGLEPESFTGIAGGTSAFGMLFSLLAALAFLELGGPVRVLGALSAPAASAAQVASRDFWWAVANQILLAINLALAIAGPLVAVAFTVQVAFALVTRAAMPVALHSFLPALRSLGVLFVFGILFHVITLALSEQIDQRLPPV